ncbi:MAG: hypothetical protein ACYDHX_09160 [Methanothrix sp.]
MRNSWQSPSLRSLRGRGPAAPGSAPSCAARGPDRPGCFVVFRASARADSSMGARACVGWLLGVPGVRSGLRARCVSIW